MKYIPIMLDVTKTKITIFGGGKVALRKIEYLEGADITVVSEKFEEGIMEKNVKMVKRRISDEKDVRSMIRDSDMVVIATNNGALNELIMNVCESERKIYNVVDDKRSKAIFPSYHNEDGIILAISTSGKAPSLSTFIRKELSKNLKYYAKALDTVEKIRGSLDSHDEEIRKKFFETLFESNEFWSLIRDGNFEGAYNFAMHLWRNGNVPG